MPQTLSLSCSMQEVNHHETYAALVDAVGGAPLAKMLLATTYKYVRSLLASEHLKVRSFWHWQQLWHALICHCACSMGGLLLTEEAGRWRSEH